MAFSQAILLAGENPSTSKESAVTSPGCRPRCSENAIERINVDFRATRTCNTRKTTQTLVDKIRRGPRYHFVNFLNMTTPDDNGTVELRFPPPTVIPDVAVDWMRFAVGFAAAAANLTDPTTLAPTIGGLRALLQSADRGASLLEEVLQASV